MSESDVPDDEFTALKPSLRRAVDTAFLKLLRQSQRTEAAGLAREKRRVESSGAGAGASADFGSDSDGEGGGGGFVKDSDVHEPQKDEEEEDNLGIPLALVPKGLQMLDLAPDDQEVLAVFRNAATGWESRHSGPARQRGSGSDVEDSGTTDKDAGLTVSRDDWRAVCAVLLGQQAEAVPEPQRKGKRKAPASARASGSKLLAPEKVSIDEPERRVTRGLARAAAAKVTTTLDEDSDEEGGGFLVGDDAEDSGDDPGGEIFPGDQVEHGPGSDEEDSPGGPDSDKYSDQASDTSESEFGAPAASKGRAKAAEKDDESDADLDETWDDVPRTLTDRQLREAKLAFALFLPGVDANDPGLNMKKIGIKEVAEAAKTLKEQLSTDDIVEMLSMFASGPDGTIGLEEFGRMAVMARLI